MHREGLLEQVRWQREIAQAVQCGARSARVRFEAARSATWVTRARSAGLRQRSELLVAQSLCLRLRLAADVTDAPWGHGGG